MWEWFISEFRFILNRISITKTGEYLLLHKHGTEIARKTWGNPCCTPESPEKGDSVRVHGTATPMPFSFPRDHLYVTKEKDGKCEVSVWYSFSVLIFALRNYEFVLLFKYIHIHIYVYRVCISTLEHTQHKHPPTHACMHTHSHIEREKREESQKFIFSGKKSCSFHCQSFQL